MPNNVDHYALIVGIRDYPALGPVATAVNDAVEFAEWLKSPTGGGVPAENIRLLLSPTEPAEPSAIRPVASDIEEALIEFGAANQERIGQRIYFYFAGRASGSNFEDAALLMANAGPIAFSSIGLRAYRNLLCQSQLFDEVVYVIDCLYVESTLPPVSLSPQITSSSLQRTLSVKEFLLMSSPLGKMQSSDDPSAVFSQGLLTRAVLDGLRGSASNSQGLITAASLGDYVQRRVRDMASGPKLLKIPDIQLPREEISFGTVDLSPLVGTVIVEVPHWSATVRVLNNLFQSIVTDIKITRIPVSSDSYQAEIKLPEGIYKIEVTLEGKSESQLVAVQFNQTNKLIRESWKTLGFASAAPLTGSATSHEWHMQPAVKWSTKVTWKDSPGGASRLFLFVRTSEPDKYNLFADGLRLLNDAEETVTDFSKGVEKNAKNGWMAFCADLEEGFYILRRGRRGVRLRQQPLYLSADWETQIFLEAHSSPSLRTMTMNMAPKGAGFKPDDEAAAAVEAVLDSLRYGSGSKRLVTGEKLSSLLRGKFENPWLGILACYALRFQQTEQSETNDLDAQSLLNHVLEFLGVIGNHPDVRALKLQADKPAATPFAYPPLMRKGLKLVHQHSTMFRDTIPLDSLTDRVLANIVTNSPWTAWRQLSDRDTFDDAITPPSGDSSAQWVRGLTEAALSQATSVLQANFPKAPVVQLAELLKQKMEGSKPSKAATRRAVSMVLKSFQDAPLLDILQTVTRTSDLDALPAAVTLKAEESMKELLQSVKAEEISKTSGLSLAHAEKGLESLRQATAPESESESIKTPARKNKLTTDEHVVLEYILTETAKEKVTAPRFGPQARSQPELTPATEDATQDAEGSGDTSDVEIVEEPTPSAVSIEDCVATMRSEALRIQLPTQDTTNFDAASDSAANNLSARLSRVADRLFERSVFTLTMSSDRRIVSANRAFIHLINPTNQDLSRKSRDRQQKAKLKAWQKALASSPVGESSLPNPTTEKSPAEFKLRKTVVQNESSQLNKTYLIALRVAGAPSANQSKLQQINDLLPSLSLYSSFFAYDSAADRGEHLEKLEEVVRKLEQLVDDSAMGAAAG